MEINKNDVIDSTPRQTARQGRRNKDSATFAQIMANAHSPQTGLKAEPASLSRLSRPRSHLELKSLNEPVSQPPRPAALERIGLSRLLPFFLRG